MKIGSQLHLNSLHNTLLIAPIKYHDYIFHNLLRENTTLFNVKLLDVNSFTNNILVDNNIDYSDESTFLKKLNIYYRLKANNQELQSSINYINELFKLENECNLSNIKLNGYSNNFDKYLNTNEIKFVDLNCQYDEIIILSLEDFYPIHQELFDELKKNNIKITDLTIQETSNKFYYEHNNMIKMLDYIIFDIYKNISIHNDILIVCDDIYQQDYLTSKFDELNITTNLTTNNNRFEVNILNSIFSLINNDYNDYDIKNIKEHYSIELLNDILELQHLEYKDYLKKLYECLYESELFETNFLNNIFKELYLNEEINLKLLNRLLHHTLQSTLKIKNDYREAKITVAGSDYCSFSYEHVYLVDASMESFKAKKSSYLLSTKEREKIDKKLITNSFYNEVFVKRQSRLLNCGTNIYIHYSLLNVDNKPQSLAYFISSLGYTLNDKSDYYHITSHQNKKNELLLKNEVQGLDKNKILEKLDNKIVLSASALDSFYKCYYKYFIDYILKPGIAIEFNPLVLGNIYHEIIEEINKLLIDSKNSYSTYSYQELLDLTTDLVTNSCNSLESDYNVKSYYLENIKERITNSIMSLIDSTIYFEQYSQYKISQSELSLSCDFKNNYFEHVKVYGKIDALLIYQDSNYILDYKSSSKDFKQKDFENGIDNQLITYLYLLKENKKDFIGAFFKAIKDEYLQSDQIINLEHNKQLHLEKNKLQGILLDSKYLDDFDSNFNSADTSVLTSYTRKKLIDYNKLLEFFEILQNNLDNMLRVIADGKFKIEPFNEKTCENCNYKNICKISNPQTRKEDEDEL